MPAQSWWNSKLLWRYPFPSLNLPLRTKLLLPESYSKIIIFVKITNFTRNSLKTSLFLGDFERVQNASKITKNNSQRIIFVTISCQRVHIKSDGKTPV